MREKLGPKLPNPEMAKIDQDKCPFFHEKTRKSRIFAFLKLGLKARNWTENQNYGKLFPGKIHNFGHVRPEVQNRILQSVRLPSILIRAL